MTQAAASASDLATHYYVKTDGSADKDGLTWETATTLANAIDQAMNGDVIHVAAGSYVPSVPLTGMKTALDNTFEIHSNFSMIGGYPPMRPRAPWLIPWRTRRFWTATTPYATWLR